jgi:nicotinate-nucleotide adenylyltransferase
VTYDTPALPKRPGTRKIGLLGGTFDPPHLGHLVAAEAVRDRLHLDEVRLVVANIPWQKEGVRPITPAHQRLRLVEAALAGASGLTCSDIELELGGHSYMAATLAELAAREPGTSWHLLLGADAAAGLETWHRPDLVRQRCRLVVIDRPGSAGGPPPGWDHDRVPIPLIGISSTMLRDDVAAGRSIRFLTPAPVVDLIERWSLYRPAM